MAKTTATMMTMLSLLQLVLVVVSLILLPRQIVVATKSYNSGGLSPTARTAALVGRVPRGGGWFGRPFRNRNRNKNNGRSNRRGGNGNDDDDDDGNHHNKKKRYPSLTQAEIEEKLNIPVFAITDLKGNSVIARNPAGQESEEDEEHIQYLFLSERMAQQTLQYLRNNETALTSGKTQLQLVPLHLGKIWFRYLQNDTAHYTTNNNSNITNPSSNSLATTTSPGADNDTKKKIVFRLVADTQNLISARLMASGIQPQEIREAMESGQPHQVHALVQKATDMGKNFTAPYNDIPLFLIPTMRAQPTVVGGMEQDGDTMSNFLGDVVDANNNNNNGLPPKPQQQQLQPRMPLFFSAKDLVQAFLQENTPTTQTKVSVTSLHQLIQMMQQESDFDFRNIIIFPLLNDSNGTDYDKDDNDDNDGGGGDFGVAAKEEDEEEQAQIEIFTDFGDSSWQEDGAEGYYQQLLSM